MRRNKKGQISAWILLSLFIPMIIIMYTHTHHHAENVDNGVCTICINHIPQTGHHSSLAIHFHKCLLCELLNLPYLLPDIIHLSFFVTTICCICKQIRKKHAILYHGRKSSRAPPLFVYF